MTAINPVKITIPILKSPPPVDKYATIIAKNSVLIRTDWVVRMFRGRKTRNRSHSGESISCLRIRFDRETVLVLVFVLVLGFAAVFLVVAVVVVVEMTAIFV